jgi:hypothetical protein
MMGKIRWVISLMRRVSHGRKRRKSSIRRRQDLQRALENEVQNQGILNQEIDIGVLTILKCQFPELEIDIQKVRK